MFKAIIEGDFSQVCNTFRIPYTDNRSYLISYALSERESSAPFIKRWRELDKLVLEYKVWDADWLLIYDTRYRYGLSYGLESIIRRWVSRNGKNIYDMLVSLILSNDTKKEIAFCSPCWYKYTDGAGIDKGRLAWSADHYHWFVIAYVISDMGLLNEKLVQLLLLHRVDPVNHIIRQIVRSGRDMDMDYIRRLAREVKMNFDFVLVHWRQSFGDAYPIAAQFVIRHMNAPFTRDENDIQPFVDIFHHDTDTGHTLNDILTTSGMFSNSCKTECDKWYCRNSYSRQGDIPVELVEVYKDWFD